MTPSSVGQRVACSTQKDSADAPVKPTAKLYTGQTVSSALTANVMKADQPNPQSFQHPRVFMSDSDDDESVDAALHGHMSHRYESPAHESYSYKVFSRISTVAADDLTLKGNDSFIKTTERLKIAPRLDVDASLQSCKMDRASHSSSVSTSILSFSSLASNPVSNPTPNEQLASIRPINRMTINWNIDGAARNEDFDWLKLEARIKLMLTVKNRFKSIIDKVVREKFGCDRSDGSVLISSCFSEWRPTLCSSVVGSRYKRFIADVTGVDRSDVKFEPYNKSALALNCALTLNCESQHLYDSIVEVERNSFKTFTVQNDDYSGRYMPYVVYKCIDATSGSETELYRAMIRYQPHPDYSFRCDAMVALKDKIDSLKSSYNPLSMLVSGELDHKIKRYITDNYDKTAEAQALKASEKLLEEFQVTSNNPGELWVLGKAKSQKLNFNIKGPTICAFLDIIPGCFDLRDVHNESADNLKCELLKIPAILNKLEKLLDDMPELLTAFQSLEELYGLLPSDELSKLFTDIPPEDSLKIFRLLTHCDDLKFPYLGKRSCLYANGEADVDTVAIIMTNPELEDMDISNCDTEDDFIWTVKQYALKALSLEKAAFISDHPCTLMAFRNSTPPRVTLSPKNNGVLISSD